MKPAIMRMSHVRRNERGGVMPMLMVVATALFISGTAFLGLGVFQSSDTIKLMGSAQAKYYANQAANIAIWRIGRTDPDTWTSWATFSDSTKSAAFDSVSNVITAVGHAYGVSETIRVHIELNPTPATLIDRIIAYERNYEVAGSSGTLTYPAGSGPIHIDQVPVLDTQYYRDHADYSYEEDQTFHCPLADGIHFVDGNIDAKNGTTLNGALIATGTIKFSGHVEVHAQQTPQGSEHYPAYYPAVASLDTTAVTAAIDGGNQNLNIWGLLYARGTIDLNPANVTGVIIGKDVYLKGSFDIAYDQAYANPPPGLVLWPGDYDPKVSLWVER